VSAAADILGALVAAKQAERTRVRWDPGAFAKGHAPQLGFVTDRRQFTHVMCARQSGKSWGDDFILGANADEHPRSVGLFLGLKGTGVKVSNWVPIWKQGVCEAHGVPADWHNETSMVTTWPNGSRVMFGGTDDLSNVKKFLGNSMRNFGVVIIDEAQDQPDGVLKYILNTLLIPMLGPHSRVIVSGVLPDVPAGYFYELAHPTALEGGACDCKGWGHHEWGRAANVHTPEAMEQLATYMRDHHLSDDDPQIQRDWYMRRVWDSAATAYRYRPAVNGYEAESPEWLDEVDWGQGRAMASEPHEHIEEFTIGIDPGGGDRTSIVVWGYGQHTQEVQHIAEWVTERDAHTALSEIAHALGALVERFPTGLVFWDPGSGSMEIDTFGTDYGVPLVRAANKSDLPGQVRRVNDLLTKGFAKVMVGSALEEDYLKARWDSDARSKRLWRWASAWHPDPSEAARYGLQGFWAQYTPPEPPKPIEQRLKEKAQRRQRRVVAAKAGQFLDEDVEASIFEEGESWT
jgi:hypothetical protein